MSASTKVFFAIPLNPIDNWSFDHAEQIIDQKFHRKLDNIIEQGVTLNRQWHEIPQFPQMYSNEEKTVIRGKLNNVIGRMKAKISKDKIPRKIRSANRTINLRDEVGTFEEIVVKHSRWENFNKHYSNRIKKWQRHVEELKLLEDSRAKSKRFYYLKSRSGNFTQTKRFAMVFDDQFDKLQSQYHSDIEMLERVHDYFKHYSDPTWTQRKIFEKFKHRYGVVLSFKKFRHLMLTLDIRFTPMHKDIGNTEVMKRQRIYFLNSLLDFHLNHSGNLLYFDVTSFNWETKTKKGWNYRISPTGVMYQRDFSPMHMLTIMDLNGIVAFQVVRDSVTSSHIFNFLFEVFQNIRNVRSDVAYRLVLDNSTLHKTLIMKNLSLEMNVHFFFIVPKNPYFNLIEYLFRFLKAKSRNRSLYRKSRK